MAFHLCIALGFPHPDHLLASLTPQQWTEWIEFASVEPIGEERADFRAAFAAANLAGCWAEGVKVDSFRIDWLKDHAKPLPLDERIRLVVQASNAIFEAQTCRQKPSAVGA